MENFSPLNIQQALLEIAALEQKMRQEGGLDSEPSDFKRVRQELEDRKISPEEALRQIRGIAESRQEYR